MAMPRSFFHVATIISGGEEKTFAVGGSRGILDRRALEDLDSILLNTVEEWVEESSTWKAADNLSHIRGQFGAVAVPVELIC